MKHETINLDAPKHDCDYIIKFPNGELLTIQLRPSNADIDYNGSLDIILPMDQAVTNWEGDDMTPARPAQVGHGEDHTLFAKQLCTDLTPYYREDDE